MTDVQTAGPRSPGRALVAFGVLGLGLVVWLLASFVGRGEARSYSTHSAPPAFVDLTAGRQYDLGTADGLSAPGVSAAVTRCTATDAAGAATALSVVAETNTKALHRVGTFVAPFSGRAHVSCSGLGPVYVDDPDGSTDSAGLLRALAVVLLAVGAPLTLSAVRRR